jgi:hypothetical protein
MSLHAQLEHPRSLIAETLHAAVCSDCGLPAHQEQLVEVIPVLHNVIPAFSQRLFHRHGRCVSLLSDDGLFVTCVPKVPIWKALDFNGLR